MSERQKRSILEKKMLINLLLRNHKVDEAITFHTCLWHYPLHKLLFVFCFGEVRTLVAMTTSFIFIVVLLPGKLSGERLQDHWSSGLIMGKTKAQLIISFIFRLIRIDRRVFFGFCI